MKIVPISYRAACAYVKEHHRHHKPPQGWRFGVAVMDDDRIVGVVMAGRPVARHLDDGVTLEVTRCCTDSSTKNAASMLYGAMVRAAKALGYTRVITYTLGDESGRSLRAAGFAVLYQTRGETWDRPNRSRRDDHPTQPKKLWVRYS